MRNNFVLQDKFTTFLKNSVDKSLLCGYNDLEGEVVSSKDITKCDRMLYYKAIALGSPKNKNLEVHHKSLVSKWVGIFEKIKNLEVIEKNYILADHNYDLVSVADIIVRYLETKLIIMIEEVSSDKFEKNTASRDHVVDIMSQMWMAEINDGFLVYEDVLTRNYNIFHVLPNVSVLNSVKSKSKDLQDKKLNGILPERKYENSDSLECRDCRFKERCWSE